jgi:hypothetical protein
MSNKKIGRHLVFVSCFDKLCYKCSLLKKSTLKSNQANGQEATEVSNKKNHVQVQYTLHLVHRTKIFLSFQDKIFTVYNTHYI